MVIPGASANSSGTRIPWPAINAIFESADATTEVMPWILVPTVQLTRNRQGVDRESARQVSRLPRMRTAPKATADPSTPHPSDEDLSLGAPVARDDNRWRGCLWGDKFVLSHISESRCGAPTCRAGLKGILFGSVLSHPAQGLKPRSFRCVYGASKLAP